MSNSSCSSRLLDRRINSLKQDGHLSRDGSRGRAQRRPLDFHDVYLYALRVAYLTYLLQPRKRRTQHVQAQKRPQVQKSSTSINDLVKDFSLIRDSKSTRFPQGFMAALDKRITNVMMGKENMQEYQDAVVKRTFAVFLNEFKEPKFRRSMEKDRRVEDLLLIFFSNATKELSRGKAPDDDGWKYMVDRHVALFVRLIRSTLKDYDWAKDRPELTSRLQTLESKLLAHDKDLTNGAQGGATVEVEVPRSREVKDMPQVLLVGRIFKVESFDLQMDITANMEKWTEQAALQDLKTYQANLSLSTGRTLSKEDFDLDEAYDAWRKAEIPDISQMMLAIMQSNPELAKTASTGPLPQFMPASDTDSGYGDGLKTLSINSDEEITSSYVIDQPVDMSALNLSDDSRRSSQDEGSPYVFIPPDPRAYYRFVLKKAIAYDVHDGVLEPSKVSPDSPPVGLLSQQSTDLLTEIALRWRIPQTSRLVLLLDVVRECFLDNEVGLETVDTAFTYVKEPPIAGRKTTGPIVPFPDSDRTMWPLVDIATYRQTLSSLHDALLRDLYDVFQHCYDTKPPSVSLIMFVLENHVQNDVSFSRSPEALTKFSEQLEDALKKRAAEIYDEMLEREIGQEQEKWEFFHVIQLGQAALKLMEKIQKRYRKNPEVVGVNPLTILVRTILPMYVDDARDIIKRIMEIAEDRKAEIPIPDGFDLYKEMVNVRQVYWGALPDAELAFPIEELLQDFVWRWVKMTDSSIVGWIDGAVKQDSFQIRAEGNQISTDEGRHSVSVVDIFRSFKQSIDQIVQLNWNDRLQHARFMTALAKSVGAGIARYCDLIEQRFNKEMDRMTPQQEAALHQTRQEKWVQLAKDTWQNKEKIEPFQFLPESLVKLNNIEFATLRLDKLEKEVDADACAEIMQRAELKAPQRKTWRVENYVFTIKIVEGEDLKACDPNGLSDPYVVLGDEYQKKALAKTRIIYGNLNPRWDESVDIITQGPVNIIATIWDWDMMGDHDCVGRTSLKLDPAHFSDFMPREYWLDLDTQGRLLVRVSMEGEKDDIQFYFGKAFRALKRTERDMTRKITDKLSAYIQHCLSRRTLRSLLSRGITISTVSSYFQRNRPQPAAQALTESDIANALKPLFAYFDDNFAIMKQTLTDTAMVMVMTRLWKETLSTIESLLVPPLSDKPSQQRQLNQQELDIVFKWLQMLFDFFHADGDGVPIDILKSLKYHDLQNLNFFYYEPTENLIRTSERMAAAATTRLQTQQTPLSSFNHKPLQSYTPSAFGARNSVMGFASVRRNKSVMLSRNLGTMKKAKEEKKKEAQAEPNDDMILRILRMRPEAERYLRDRARQKERLAAAAAAEEIVRKSLMQSSRAGQGRTRY